MWYNCIMKTCAFIWPLACGTAFFAAAASALTAAAVEMTGYEQGRLVPMTQKSFEDLRDLTDRRIAEIRATPNIDISSIPSGTKVYYASTKNGTYGGSGTKSNPWKNLSYVNNANLENGSYVLFERGSVFRGTLNAKSGVTYSAYGDGPKPCFYTSPANGADSTKWTQMSDAPNVWRYAMGYKDVGTIVFDGGREHAIKIVPVFHTNGVRFTQQYTGEPFTSGYKDLAHDLHFWHDFKKYTAFTPSTGSGYLYLYSANGNPGNRFRSIEFCAGYNQHAINVDTNNNVTIDNLCIKYAGAHGISGTGSSSAVKKLKVTNCEFGWIGGSVQWENSEKVARFGNAVEIYGGCNNFVVDNCYIYQVYDAGITQQYDLSPASQIMNQKNMRYSNNVIECCNYSIEYFLANVSSSNTSLMENFTIASNIMWNAGTGFCQQRPVTNEAAHIKGWGHQNRAKNFVIRDNVLACSKAMLIHVNPTLVNSDGSDSLPAMTGNVFIGAKGRRLGYLNQGIPVGLIYDRTFMPALSPRYSGNWFLTEPKGKYSLLVTPPGPHVAQ